MSESQKFDLKTSEGGRGFIANLFVTVLRRHDFTAYIKERLAADFACALSQSIACAQARESELQKRLTAADERADVLTTALNRIQFRCQSFIEGDWSMAVESVEAVLGIAEAALKPAEGGGDDPDDHDRSAQAYWADQAAQGKPYEQQLREACERNGIAHGLDEE